MLGSIGEEVKYPISKCGFQRVFSFPTGSSVDFTTVFVEEIKASITIVNLILQRGLTHDGGAPAFAAFDVLDHLQHVFNAVGVEVPLQTLPMSPLDSLHP